MKFDDLKKHMPKDLLDYLETFKDVPQDPEWHPEGSAYTHIVMVVDAAAKYEDPDLTMAALFHDFGKDRTTFTDEDGKVRSPGHSQYSLEVLDMYQDFVKKMGADFGVVQNLVKYHMDGKPTLFKQMKKKKQELLKKSVWFDKLEKFVECDNMRPKKKIMVVGHVDHGKTAMAVAELASRGLEVEVVSPEQVEDIIPQPIIPRDLPKIDYEFPKLIDNSFSFEPDGQKRFNKSPTQKKYRKQNNRKIKKRK